MIKALHHVGISVTNLDSSIRFYQELLGMQIIAAEPFEGDDCGGAYGRILALKFARGRVAFLTKGDFRLELFEFSQPVSKAADPQRPVSDHGISHFCIEVSDIEREYQRLQSSGVFFHCPPLRFGSTLATYGRDPDGNVFELLESMDRATSSALKDVVSGAELAIEVRCGDANADIG